MATKRKNVSVAEMVAKVNHYLAVPNSQYVNADTRHGAAQTLETMLHLSGQYRGFMYQSGFGPYLFGEDGQWLTDADGETLRNPNHDESRRVYIFRD